MIAAKKFDRFHTDVVEMQHDVFSSEIAELCEKIKDLEEEADKKESDSIEDIRIRMNID